MFEKIPTHVAIIMDGNGRWAKKRNLPRTMGHIEGAKTLRKILEHAIKKNIKYLTVYAFSTENWKRSDEEVNALMSLFSKYIKKERKNLMDNEVRFYVSGSRKNISKKLLEEIDEISEFTKNNKKIVLNIAFNYGGRNEIIEAINAGIKNGEQEFTEEILSKYLYNNFPDPDLIIRTAGEYRVSNFLLWQMAYSEIYVSEKTWPDFDEEEFDRAIMDFNKRERKFGGV